MSNITSKAQLPPAEVLATVLLKGDLSKLTAEQKTSYYMQVCESVGLNPLTKPLAYMQFRTGTEVLYASKDATDQLRTKHSVSIIKMESKTVNDVHVVTAYAKDKDGREDVSTGAVNIAGLKGDALANALMKAETKAKRRVTLSICGLGLLDETEIETIADAKPKEAIDLVTGEIVNKPTSNHGSLASTLTNRDAPVRDDEYIFTFGKFRNMRVSEVKTEDLESYSKFLPKLENQTPMLKEAVECMKMELHLREGRK